MLPNVLQPALPPSAPATRNPELFWIGTTHERSCLWPRQPTRPTAEASPLEPFVESVLATRSRIWILDTFFEGTNGYALLQPPLDLVLADARRLRRQIQVRIMTGRLQELQRWLAENHISTIGVEIRGRASGFHDRYALVDEDLWHFGSTVGGGHEALSSASRGWADHVADFEKLFLNWWG